MSSKTFHLPSCPPPCHMNDGSKNKIAARAPRGAKVSLAPPQNRGNKHTHRSGCRTLRRAMRGQRVLIVGAAVIGVVGAAIVAARRRARREDAGIALLDLFAAVGDLLSAYQDQIADEAYLGSETTRRARPTHAGPFRRPRRRHHA